MARVLESRRVEGPEVGPDDLARGVALDPLGAGVPALHDPFGREHEDRVVLDVVDQQPEADLAAPQQLLGAALPADVLHLDEEVERSPTAVEHRGERRDTRRWVGQLRARRARPARTCAEPSSRSAMSRCRRGRPRRRRTRRTPCRPASSTERSRISARAALARATRPASVTVAIPIAASSKTSRKRSRCSRSTRSVGLVVAALRLDPHLRRHGLRRVARGAARRGRRRASPAGWTSPGRPRRRAASARWARPRSWKPLYIATLVPGEAARIRGSASRPSMTGIDTSSSTRSGWCSSTAAIAWTPSVASATTSTLRESRSRVRTSERTSGGVVDDHDRRQSRVHTRSSGHPRNLTATCRLVQRTVPRRGRTRPAGRGRRAGRLAPAEDLRGVPGAVVAPLGADRHQPVATVAKVLAVRRSTASSRP